MQEQLKQYADIITGDNSYFGEISKAATELHSLFVAAGGINAYIPTGNGTQFSTGKALSAESAALCLFDLARTRKFSRGLLQAIKKAREKNNDKPVQVLYAGCGPYALLSMLALTYFSADEVQFTLLDIHEDSVRSAEKMISFFDVKKYFAELHVADATQFIWQNETAPDILLIETMQNGLQNEQQVSIAAHLAPLLGPDGTMVPEKITVTPVFADQKIRRDLMFGKISPPETSVVYSYEPIAVLDIASATRAGKNIRLPFPEKTIELNEAYASDAYELELHTTISIFGNEELKDQESGISLPVPLYKGGQLKGKQRIKFTYENNERPGFAHEMS